MEMTRSKLLLIAAIFIAPILAYYVWTPEGGMTNYGELIATPLPDAAMTDINGKPFHLGQLKGKWVLMTADAASCNKDCDAKLYLIRQIRLTLGRDADRIERLWLITDDGMPAQSVKESMAGMWMVRGKGNDLLGKLPAKEQLNDHIYVIDPHGNLVMRYNRNPDPKKMKKDIETLFKASMIG
jgi:cytochrome oxidase Cu insertion factor (SCO1/SenC/PrrC family)